MSPRQPIKLSDLDKSRMQHGEILNKHICELDLMFMKHYAPNRCLYIKVAKLRTGVGSAKTSSFIPTKLQCQTIQRSLQSPNLQREIIREK